MGRNIQINVNCDEFISSDIRLALTIVTHMDMEHCEVLRPGLYVLVSSSDRSK